jgi:thiol-disulfide isomerase/thioredoxin
MPFLRVRTLIVLALLLLAVAVSVLYVIHTRPVHARLTPPAELARLEWEATPRPVPAIGFAAVDGKRSTLAAFAGHFVVLDLWATWCAPCVRELPQLAALKSALPGLVVVPVNVGRNTAAQTAAFLNAHGAAKLAAYVDSDAAFIRAFNAQGLPVSVLIDPEGREIARALGPCDWGTPAAIAYLRHLIAPAAPSS